MTTAEFADFVGAETEEVVETQETIAQFQAAHGLGSEVRSRGRRMLEAGVPCRRWEGVQAAKGLRRGDLWVADLGTCRVAYFGGAS